MVTPGQLVCLMGASGAGKWSVPVSALQGCPGTHSHTLVLRAPEPRSPPGSQQLTRRADGF